ncbi:MAG: 3-dehydroquinate synthase [Planctomycetota bacterium]
MSGVHPNVQVSLPGHTYDLVVEAGALSRLGERVRAAVPSVRDGGRAALITDEGVEPYHGRAVASAMQAQGLDTTVHVIPVSEKKKTLGTVQSLYTLLLESRHERGHPVVSLGGGICGDVTGFVAATYLRGVPFVQCPTTLLAMVDASVGGKTGVNMPQGKNLIGSFWQPDLVVADVDVLSTLPERELKCGLAECLKHGVIRDATLFDWIVQHADRIAELDRPTLIELVERNVRIKADVVMADEREAGERAHLNFGHTFAHAIEATTQFGGKYKHGEAVSLGMVAAATLAAAVGLCDASVPKRIADAVERVGLPNRGTLAPTALLLKAMGHDKKVQSGKIRLVLPTSIGAVTIRDDLGAEQIGTAWDAIRA